MYWPDVELDTTIEDNHETLNFKNGTIGYESGTAIARSILNELVEAATGTDEQSNRTIDNKDEMKGRAHGTISNERVEDDVRSIDEVTEETKKTTDSKDRSSIQVHFSSFSRCSFLSSTIVYSFVCDISPSSKLPVLYIRF